MKKLALTLAVIALVTGIASATLTIARSTDGEAQPTEQIAVAWIIQDFGTGSDVKILAESDSEEAYVEGLHGEPGDLLALRSTDGGQHWEVAQNPIKR